MPKYWDEDGDWNAEDGMACRIRGLGLVVYAEREVRGGIGCGGDDSGMGS